MFRLGSWMHILIRARTHAHPPSHTHTHTRTRTHTHTHARTHVGRKIASIFDARSIAFFIHSLSLSWEHIETSLWIYTKPDIGIHGIFRHFRIKSTKKNGSQSCSPILAAWESNLSAFNLDDEIHILVFSHWTKQQSIARMKIAITLNKRENGNGNGKLSSKPMHLNGHEKLVEKVCNVWNACGI